EDRAKNLLPHLRHAVVLRIVDQDVADQTGLVGDNQRPADAGAYRYPRLVVGRLAPQFERVAVDDAQHLERRGRLLPRLRRWGKERSWSRIHRHLVPATGVDRPAPST